MHFPAVSAGCMNFLKFFWPEGGGGGLEIIVKYFKECKLVLLRDISMLAPLTLLKFPFGLPVAIGLHSLVCFCCKPL